MLACLEATKVVEREALQRAGESEHVPLLSMRKAMYLT